jgi:hypothetical protein
VRIICEQRGKRALNSLIPPDAKVKDCGDAANHQETFSNSKGE